MLKKFVCLPFKSKCSYILKFHDNFQTFIKMKPTNLGKIKEKEKAYNTVSELYKKMFKYYYNEYNELSDVKKDQGHEEVKEGKGLKILTLNKL